MSTENYCNNCGKLGHMFYQCKVPITSIGIIAVRQVEREEKPSLEYLMIRRKDTLGHIDFMRGKYSVHNKHYLMNMLNQMTREEKERMRSGDFDLLWRSVWGKSMSVASMSVAATANSSSHQFRSEELTSREKYNWLFQGSSSTPSLSDSWRKEERKDESTFTLLDLMDESDRTSYNWDEPEWGFPKGRRNPQEKDYDCALREFSEETGIPSHFLHNVQNLMPFEEIFTGSNYKSYKHKYYVMLLDPGHIDVSLEAFEKSEVSKVEWKTFEEATQCIRAYNVEKLRLINDVNLTLTTYPLTFHALG